MLNITNNKLIFNFDTSKFNFIELFSDFLNIEINKLDLLHEIFSDKLLLNKVLTPENDQDQEIYKILYQIDQGYKSIHSDDRGNFFVLYDSFVKYIAENIFKEDLIFQKKPTLRVSFPNSMAVGGWHRDRDYNHPQEEINIWLPITSAFDSNTIWIESEFDKEDYEPMNLNYGDFLIFDSGLKHGNVKNIENRTRISFDFRVIPKRLFTRSQKTSLNQKIKFDLDHYYLNTNMDLNP